MPRIRQIKYVFDLVIGQLTVELEAYARRPPALGAMRH